MFFIEPRTPQEWGLFAYHIGNRHLPLMFTELGIVCPDVAGAKQLLEQQRIPFVRATLSFTPAASVANHHDHD
jgi:urease accessory protein UreE